MAKSKPTISQRAAERICPNCAAPSAPRKSTRGPAPRYCSEACKREKGNRDLRDGLSLVNFVKAWRADRGTGEIAKASFARVCQIADMLNEEDRKAGRPRADYNAAVLLETQMHSVCDLRYGRKKLAESRAAAMAAA